MKSYSSGKIRNIAVLGHGGSGKTNLVEAMAFLSGATKRQGKVYEGNTISDFDDEEIKRKISMATSVVPVEWENHKINLLDTPGYFDFAGEVKEAIRVADSALIVISGRTGVAVGTEKSWEHAEERQLPKMFFVTDMDDEQANLYDILNDLKELYGKRIAPFQVPIRENGEFVGFVNVIKMEGRKFVKDHIETCEIPETLKEEIEPIREMILEAVAERSEELMEKYFMQEEFTLEEIQNALHEGVIEGEVIPVLCGSGKHNIGIQVLLNSIVKYMPSPTEEHATLLAKDIDSQELINIKCSEDETLSALVFKTIIDPYIGKISLFRVYSGILKSDATLYNSNQETTEKINHLYCLRGKQQIEVKEIKAGDIGAVTKLSATYTGDTLCNKERPIELEGIQYPESLSVMAIRPKNKGDEDKISSGLQKLIEEDPTIKVEIDSANHQELIYGLGEQHLEVVVSKLQSKFNVEVELYKPKVPYKETIKGKIKIQGKHKKQSGGHGQYGDVIIEFEPLTDLNRAYEFEEKIFGGAVPKNFFPAVEKGLEESVQKGVLAGYPVVGLKATLVDGSYHPVDSSEMAFKIATTIAFKKGVQEANPILLEPIVSVRVLIPNDYMGDIIGDLNKRRGRVLGMVPLDGKQEIQAEVPMSEMFGYTTDLRSMTQGRGTFTMKIERYEQVPSELQNKVIEESKKEA
ncbi:elongation factor G [Natranaerovirga hydrolytica]|uniref:Elongation factor G n=1 Tax=Natranaerovirga hydrolytica TaxID=680378 RepID=A0A4R1MQP4_9FIRM|nr:elongation factor G [Natranaerovirga hydrolytica]TCK92859.1 elongation factor G [Natranaerovirga hydrolytica]